MIKYLFIFLSFFVFVSCATPSYPTGGEKDTKPPKLLSTYPLDSSINFKSKEIVFNFDEFVQIANPIQSIIITPSPKSFPTILAKKKQLVIKFKEPLLDSTTYLISFGNALKDLNEGNSIDNFNFVFSTGPTLDSLSVRGTLLYSESNPFPPNTFVGLYKSTDDSVLYKQKPDYIFNLKSPGSFEFKNLKSATYRCFALADKNFNFIFDLPSEAVGFYKNPIIVTPDSTYQLNVVLFNSAESSFRITNFSNNFVNGSGFIELNKPIPINYKWTINEINKKCSINNFELNPERNKITFWADSLVKNNKYDLSLFINGLMVDSFVMICNSVTENNVLLELTSNQLNKDNLIEIKPDNILLFKSSIPLGKSGIVKPIFVIDSITNTSKEINYAVDNQIITIINVLEDSIFNKIFLPKGTFMSYNGVINDSLLFRIKSVKGNELGSINLTIKFPSNSANYIVKIYNTTNGFSDLLRVNNMDSIVWIRDNLWPGNYNIEVIFDENYDGVYTNGSLNDFRLPEHIYVHNKPLVLKNNWELEETIVVSRETIILPNKNQPKDDSMNSNEFSNKSKTPSSLIKE